MSVLCGLILAWGGVLLAADAEPLLPPEKDKARSSSEPSDFAPHRVDESLPSIYYLKDKQGNLQAVPNFTLEDFEELYKLKHQLVQSDQRPRYSLQQMLAGGSVNATGQAELTLQFRILVRDEQWTRIPLRLDQAILREPAQYQGAGEHLVSFEGDGTGYVVWLRGPAGQQHQVTLKILVPLVVAGQETRLHLLVPKTTAAQLKLKVPCAKAMAKVSEGATLQTPGSGSKETELVAVGLNGDFELSWHPPEVAPGNPATLEAYGSIVSRINGRGVECDATLTVRSNGQAFDRFRVRLPSDAELVPGTTSGYTVTAVDPGSGGGRQKVVEVQLAKRTAGPVEVRLAAKRIVDLARADNWLELAGFEIPEATRQWGTITVSVVGDWQVLWGSNRGVRQIDQPPDSLRQKDVVAGYEYFAQPASLMARLVPRKTRIGVEPEYLLLVESDQVRLDARLRYTVRGGKVFAVDLAMPDWQIDEVGPEGVVAVDGVPTAAPGPVVSLPLQSPSTGQFEVRVRAHRPLPADAKSFSVALPQPQVGAPAAAVVAVLPADNIEIIPNAQATTGLLRQSVPLSLELPRRQQEPLTYRSDAPKAVFAAGIRRHRQATSVNVHTRLTIDRSGGRVEQTLAYTIAYEPTDVFVLEVPRELGENGRLEMSHEDHVLVPVLMENEEDDGAGPLRMRVAMPAACIGPCQIKAVYAAPPLTGENGGEVRVPLIMPLEAELTANRLVVAAGASQRVEILPGEWSQVGGEPVPGGTSRVMELTSSRRTTDVVLRLYDAGGSDAAVVVERAWIQTCITRSAEAGRRDRMSLQLRTRRRQLEITLPPEAVLDEETVTVNRSPVSALKRGDRTFAVPLPSDAESQPCVLGWSYEFPGPRPALGTTQLEFPGLGEDARFRRVYWQLLLPPEEHLAVSPRKLTSEFAWGWNRFYFGRQPVMGTADLEAWVGAPQQGGTAVPSGMNSYLFSSFGAIASCQIVTLGRSTIVFLASGIVLAAGLLLIYLPALRHPAVVLVTAAVLAGATAASPELALMGAQASAVGLALVVLAAVLRRLLTLPKEPAIPELSGVTTSIMPAPRVNETVAPIAAAPGSSPATTIPPLPDAAT